MSKAPTKGERKAARAAGVTVWRYAKARDAGATHAEVLAAHEVMNA